MSKMTSTDTMTVFEISAAQASPERSGWVVSADGHGDVKTEWLEQFRSQHREINNSPSPEAMHTFAMHTFAMHTFAEETPLQPPEPNGINGIKASDIWHDEAEELAEFNKNISSHAKADLEDMETARKDIEAAPPQYPFPMHTAEHAVIVNHRAVRAARTTRIVTTVTDLLAPQDMSISAHADVFLELVPPEEGAYLLNYEIVRTQSTIPKDAPDIANSPAGKRWGYIWRVTGFWVVRDSYLTDEKITEEVAQVSANLDKLELAAEEAECAHRILDEMEVPKEIYGEKLSLVERIRALKEGKCDQTTK